MVQDLYIGQGVTVGLNKNKILEGFGYNSWDGSSVADAAQEGDAGRVIRILDSAMPQGGPILRCGGICFNRHNDRDFREGRGVPVA